MLVNHRVDSVDFDKKRVFSRDLKTTREVVVDYDQLVIASGARPLIPKIDGIDAENVYTLTKPYEARRLKEDLNKYKKIAIIGGGFIGVETAEQLARNKNLNISLYHSRDQLLNKIYDSEAGKALEEEFTRLGVKLIFGERLKGLVFEEARVKELVTTNRKDRVDALILGLGFVPNTDIFDDKRLEKTKNGAIVIDKFGRTSIEDVWSVGDCATVPHKFLGNVHIPLGTSANKLGRLVGINLFRDPEDMTSLYESLGSSFIKVGELEFGSTGLNEAQAKSLGLDYKIASSLVRNKPPYMPGSFPINFRVIYEKKSKKLLGARVFGKEDANIRLHAFSVAISAGLTTDFLAYLDFAYSPPFNGVWEAINIAASVAK